MNANPDCIRDVLCYIYNNLDELERIRLSDIMISCSYSREELTDTLNRMIRDGLIVVQPTYTGDKLPVVVDITVDGVECMRKLAK